MYGNETNKTGSPFGFDLKFHPILITIALVVIISNGFVIVLFITKEVLRNGGKLLLLSLAISDITTGLVTIPLNIGCEVTFKLELCWSSGILNRFLAISTVYHILAITCETYYAILRPVEHRVKVDKRKVLGIASLIWCGALIIALAPLLWLVDEISDVRQKPSEDFLRKMVFYECVVIAVGFVFPLSCMIFAHVRMFAKIINALKLFRRQSSPSRGNSSQSKKNKYKTAFLFAVILLIFTICWFFWFLLSLLNIVSNKSHQFPEWAVDALIIVRYFTSFINPLLYTFFRPDFYTAFKSFVAKKPKRRLSVTLTYLLSGSASRKRDSQTTTTMAREQSAAPILNANTPSSGSCKSVDKDTEV